MKISVGKKLYFSILSVFLVFAVAFIVFQQDREKQFKIDTLNLKLQDYNSRMEEYLRLFPDFSEEALDRYVHTHYIPNIRVTLIRNDGKVLYDSKLKDYSNIANHATRPETATARPYTATSSTRQPTSPGSSSSYVPHCPTRATLYSRCRQTSTIYGSPWAP